MVQGILQTTAQSPNVPTHSNNEGEVVIWQLTLTIAQNTISVALTPAQFMG